MMLNKKAKTYIKENDGYFRSEYGYGLKDAIKYYRSGKKPISEYVESDEFCDLYFGILGKKEKKTH